MFDGFHGFVRLSANSVAGRPHSPSRWIERSETASSRTYRVPSGDLSESGRMLQIENHIGDLLVAVSLLVGLTTTFGMLRQKVLSNGDRISRLESKVDTADTHRSQMELLHQRIATKQESQADNIQRLAQSIDRMGECVAKLDDSIESRLDAIERELSELKGMMATGQLGGAD